MNAENYRTAAAKWVADRPAWHVAECAEAQIDNDEARAFWERIRDDVAEAFDYAEGDEPDGDAIAEVADNAPSIYNYERMMQAIGTGAYMRESEIASGGEDMLTLAGYVLYETASDAACALVREALEAVES